MNNYFKNLSIKNKLKLIILSVTFFSLFAGFSFIMHYDIKHFQKELVQQTVLNAKLIGEYCVTPIVFYDKKGAEEVLGKIESIPYIESGVVIDDSGNIFASVNAEDSELENLEPVTDTKIIHRDKYIYTAVPINYHDLQYGTIYLKANDNILRLQISRYLYTIGALMIVLISVSYILALRFQRVLSQPILRLAEITEKISVEADFSVRVYKEGNDEIGVLYDSFNNMLEQINVRERERDKASEELRNTRNYLKNVFDSLSSMLISVNTEGVITQWNTAAEKYTGISATDAVSKKLWEVAPFLGKYQANFKKVVDSKQPEEIYREMSVLDDKKFLNIAIYPLAYNGTRGIVMRVDDVTELETKDQQLRQAQKMETVGNLAGGLAHDFNNVLSGIIGTVSLMKFGISSKKLSFEKIEDYLKVIEESADRAADMVQQLLALSKKHELSFSSVDLNKSVKRVIKICENTFDKRIEIKPIYYDGKAVVQADATQIEQVVLNLCVNASHAMTIMRKSNEQQGGVLTVSIEQIYADKTFNDIHHEAEEGYYYIVTVRDTGVGMDSRVISKIFDPFFTTKDKNKGTGLGLAMAYNIIQQHKGFIDVYSEVGVGSKFSVFIPSQSVSDEISEKTASFKITKGSGTILVIDDEEIIRYIGKNILEECGYNVLLAEDGRKGIEIYKAKKDEITAVILDMSMPYLSGKDTYIELKKINPKIKVLLASGFKQDKRVSDALKLGVNSFIQKPYSLIELSKKIDEVIKSD